MSGVIDERSTEHRLADAVAEVAELHRHIYRWAESNPSHDDLHSTKTDYDGDREGETYDFCWCFEVRGPCPTEVAKGWRE